MNRLILLAFMTLPLSAAVRFNGLTIFTGVVDDSTTTCASTTLSATFSAASNSGAFVYVTNAPGTTVVICRSNGTNWIVVGNTHTIAQTLSILKGDNAGNAVAAITGTDYVVPSGTVATATALATTPNKCAAGSYASGVDAAGNALNCTSVPAAQVNSDWNASSGMATILNKPTLAASATIDTTSAANITSGTLQAARLPVPSASSLGGVQSKDCSSGGQFIQKITTDGSETCATPAGVGNVNGPGSSTNGFLATWNGATGTLLGAGMAVSAVPAANTAVESGAGGTIAAGWMPDLSGTYQASTSKGSANGYASLDAGSMVPIAQIPTGQTGSTVAFGNDARFSDTRTPLPHASSHASNGSDPLVAATASVRGTVTTTTSTAQVVSNDDSRMTNARTPTAHASTHRSGGSDEIAAASPAANAIPKADATGKLNLAWIPDLSSTYQLLSGENVANGYAGLDASGKYPWTGLSGVPSSFWPSAHASTHATGGSDPISPAVIGAQAVLGYTSENAANKSADTTLSGNSDTSYPSQKAAKTYADTKVAGSLVTTVGAPGLDTNVPTEKAVRAAIVASATGMTGPGTTVVGNLLTWANTAGTSAGAGMPVTTTVASPGVDTNISTEKSIRTAITAASAFSAQTTGTNTTANMTVGSGGSLVPSSATMGIVSANRLNDTSLAGLGTGLVKNTTGTGVPSIASAGTDYAAATSGSAPLKGNGAGGFSSAVAADIVTLFSSCSGTQYLGADGACHTSSGGGGGGNSISATFTAGATASRTLTHNFGSTAHNAFQCLASDGSIVLPSSITLGATSDVYTFVGGLALDTTCTATAGSGGSLVPAVYPYIDVTAPSLGAKCDGATDDSAAFQAAVNQASTSVGGGHSATIKLPGGSCLINSTIHVTAPGIRFEGDSSQTTLLLWGGGAGTLFQFDYNKQSTITSAVRSGGTVTLTVPHPPSASFYNGGFTVVVAGVTDSSFNGTFTNPTTTSSSGIQTLTYPQAGANSSSSSGTVRSAYDNPEYDGIAKYGSFKNISMSVKSPTTVLNEICKYPVSHSYTPGAIAVASWRSGRLTMDHVSISSFDYWFYGVQSDLNTFNSMEIMSNHSGGYFGPRSDQQRFNEGQSACNDQVWTFDSVADENITHWTTDSDGSSTTSPVTLLGNYTRGTHDIVFDGGPWFENFNGSTTDAYPAFISIPTPTVGGVSDVYLYNPYLSTSNAPSLPRTNSLVKMGDGVNGVNIIQPAGPGWSAATPSVGVTRFVEFTGSTSPNASVYLTPGVDSLPSPLVLNSGSGTLTIVSAAGIPGQFPSIKAIGNGYNSATASANNISGISLYSDWWNGTASQHSNWEWDATVNSSGIPTYYQMQLNQGGPVPAGVTPAVRLSQNWQTAAADGSANVPSWQIRHQSQYGNGSALAPDAWTQQAALGTGTAPTSVYINSHFGTSGVASLGAPAYSICTGLAASTCTPVLPSFLRNYHGTSAPADTYAQLSNGTGATGNLATFDAGGGLTNGPIPSTSVNGQTCALGGTCTIATSATQTYPCTAGLYNGGAAITAGTYTLSGRCLNIFGGNYTITAVQAYSDNNGASSCNAANNSGTGLQNTAVTATKTWAPGAQSATTTITSGGWVNWTVVADGTSTTINCVMTITH